jgi:anti-sigma regulatory factor (Ser/Thr protein kinase)
MTSDRPPLSLTMASDLALLPVARAFVEAACRAGGLDRSTTYSIVLAVNEAISNVIRHAHQDLPQAELQIHCRFHPDAVEIQILDEGKPFDLSAVPHLDPGEIRIGGRGVFLMRTLMDELSCQPRGQRGNALRMLKRCRRES